MYEDVGTKCRIHWGSIQNNWQAARSLSSLTQAWDTADEKKRDGYIEICTFPDMEAALDVKAAWIDKGFKYDPSNPYHGSIARVFNNKLGQNISPIPVKKPSTTASKPVVAPRKSLDDLVTHKVAAEIIF